MIFMKRLFAVIFLLVFLLGCQMKSINVSDDEKAKAINISESYINENYSNGKNVKLVNISKINIISSSDLIILTYHIDFPTERNRVEITIKDGSIFQVDQTNADSIALTSDQCVDEMGRIVSTSSNAVCRGDEIKIGVVKDFITKGICCKRMV